jgi:Lipid A 3-O-deacylase (PagL)
MENRRRFFSHRILMSLWLILSASPSYAEQMEPLEPMAVIVAPQMGAVGKPARPERPTTGITFLGAGPRYGVGGDSPLGEEQKERFRLYDLAALLKLPWEWRGSSTAYRVETRFIASAGELTAAGQTSFMSTLVPLLALTSPEGAIAIDAGIGPGFFTNYKFGVQNFGGPVQIVGTAGIGFTLFSGFHAGYRFQHFSDAGMYGPASLGVDMHIMDIRYKF